MIKGDRYMVDEPSKITSTFTSDRSNIESNLSRYNNLLRLTNEAGKTYIETPYKIKIKETVDDSLYSVESGYENRLDLISYKFYGTPLLWWAIATVNNISNPLDIDVGIVLRIPTMRSIYESGYITSY